MDRIADIPMPNHEVIGPAYDAAAYDALWDITHKAIAVLMTYRDDPGAMSPEMRDLGMACCELLQAHDAAEARRQTQRQYEITRLERLFGSELWD